uniref:Putative secreted protein n=1 Tax=Ixodes ricinus TaxID=34613 RepID=A0A6B0U9I3_IXORI
MYAASRSLRWASSFFSWILETLDAESGECERSRLPPALVSDARGVRGDAGFAGLSPRSCCETLWDDDVVVVVTTCLRTLRDDISWFVRTSEKSTGPPKLVS